MLHIKSKTLFPPAASGGSNLCAANERTSQQQQQADELLTSKTPGFLDFCAPISVGKAELTNTRSAPPGPLSHTEAPRVEHTLIIYFCVPTIPPHHDMKRRRQQQQQ